MTSWLLIWQGLIENTNIVLDQHYSNIQIIKQCASLHYTNCLINSTLIHPSPVPIRAEEDIKETLEKEKVELNRAIETNLEDTTKAVVMLRKEFNDQISSGEEQRNNKDLQLKANIESIQVGKIRRQSCRNKIDSFCN